MIDDGWSFQHMGSEGDDDARGRKCVSGIADAVARAPGRACWRTAHYGLEPVASGRRQQRRLCRADRRRLRRTRAADRGAGGRYRRIPGGRECGSGPARVPGIGLACRTTFSGQPSHRIGREPAACRRVARAPAMPDHGRLCSCRGRTPRRSGGECRMCYCCHVT